MIAHHRRLSHALLGLGSLLLVGGFAVAQAPEEPATVYQRQGTWQETMAVCREQYLAWLDNELRQRPVDLGPWYVTRPLKAEGFDTVFFPERGVDIAAKNAKGEPTWQRKDDYRDGVVQNLPGPGSASTYLYRNLKAARAMEVNVSLGSDDGIEAWLNGEKVLSHDVPRVAAPDQERLTLKLQEGDNAFLMKIYNRTGGYAYYFALRDDPANRLWKRIAQDYPTESKWLGQDAPGNSPMAWFAPGEAPDFERAIIAAALGASLQESAMADRVAELMSANTPRGDRQWLDLYVQARTCRGNMDRLEAANVEAVQRAVHDLAADFPQAYPMGATYLDALATAEDRLAQLRTACVQGDVSVTPQVDALLEELREPLLANPLLDFDTLLLIQRRANRLGLPQNWQGNCSMSPTGYDNVIMTFSPVRPTGTLATLYKPEQDVFVGDVDLHFDGGKMLFSMPDARNRWQIWEVCADGTGLRQVTPGEFDDVDNYDACYLPDERIIFDSTRCFQGIPCVGGNDSVANLFIMNPDGTGIRQLCFDQDHNWCPTMMNDGRILFTRWEYSDTPHYFSRLVFSMNPDGTNQMEHYGSNSFWPNSVFYSRPIPGHPTEFVAIVSGHHGVPRMGELVLFDPALGRFEGDGVVQRIPGYGQKVEPIIKDQLVNDSWPRFLHPYPLSDKYFLVSCQPNPSALWGLYLVDVFDNMTLLKEVPDYALLEPVPLKSTPRPPVIRDKVEPDNDRAIVYLADIYAGQGLKGVPKGTVKALRVYEFHYAYPKMGGHIHVAVEGTWDVHRILGTVPVDEDGSALFEVPANTPLAVQPLDEKGRALQLMRSWFAAMPGEVLSCVGCHERQNQSAPQQATLAARRKPSTIAEWYGPARGFSFKRDVQPVLNKYCVGCHNGAVEGRPNLCPKEENGWSGFTPAYLALHPYVRRPGPESNYHMLAPLEFCADTSELVQMLEKGHHNVVLDGEAWERLFTWIDLNVPDHGTWHEHRPIPSNYHERRLEMRRRFANRPEDPEAIPALPARDDVFVKPTPSLIPAVARPVCQLWPFSADEAQQMQAAASSETRRTVELGDGVAIELTLVPAGEYVMGDPNGYPDETPLTKVRIAEPFWMGTTEISNAQFARYDAQHDSGFLDQHHKDHTLPGYSASEPDQPVIRVSWEEAMGFCAWLSDRTGQVFSLPTEAQWEWACRAGTDTPLSYGGLDTDFSAFANLADASISKLAVSGVNPQPIRNPNEYQDFLPKDARYNDGEKLVAYVGRYETNPWGLRDMHGNVAEWTLTAYRAYPYAADGRDTPGGDEKRVVRGGSWRDRPKHARSGFRLAYQPWRKVFNVGFRVVCPAAGPDRHQVARHVSPAG